MLPIADAAERGVSNILVRTVDTDVVVLAVATVQELGMSEIWIAFGTGKVFRYVPASVGTFLPAGGKPGGRNTFCPGGRNTFLP